MQSGSSEDGGKRINNNRRGAGIVVQQVPATLLIVPFPANVPKTAVDDGPSTWDPVIHR